MQGTTINYVPGRGSCSPKVFMVGEAPGEFENFRLQPFVGPSGELLREFMATAGLNDENAYLTNVVKFRPVDNFGKNRTPSAEEILISSFYLAEEISILGNPIIIVPIGTVATKVFIPDIASIFQVAGTEQNKVGLRIFPMVHPAYILRNPALKKKFVEDWEWLGGAIE